jgi:hypothetical protein
VAAASGRIVVSNTSNDMALLSLCRREERVPRFRRQRIENRVLRGLRFLVDNAALRPAHQRTDRVVRRAGREFRFTEGR